MKASELLNRYKAGERKFPGINLAGKSFKGQNLSNIDFSSANLQGANFSGANLTDANLSNASIQGTNFTNTDLTKGNLTQTITGLSKTGKILPLILSLFLLILSLIFFFTVPAFTIYYFSPDTIKEYSLRPGLYFLSTVLYCCYYLFTSKNILATYITVSGLVMIVIVAVGQWEIVEAVMAGHVVLISPLIVSVAIVIGSMVGVRWSALLAVIAIILALLIGLGTAIILEKNSIIANDLLSFLLFTIGTIKIAIISLTIYIYLRWRSDTNKLPFVPHIEKLINYLLGNNDLSSKTSKDNKQLKFRGLEFAFARQVTNLIATFFGTNFSNAILTDADFSYANLQHTNLLTKKLTRTRFYEAKNLHLARVGKSILNDPIIRDLVVNETKNNKCFVGLNLQGVNLKKFDLIDADFTNANLNDANLEGAFLTNANLKLAKVFGTDFTRVEMTGACLEKLQYDSTTIFKEVVCKFVFLQEKQDSNGNRKRNPTDINRNFDPGDFEKHFQETANIVPILLHHPVDLKKLNLAFQKLIKQKPKISLDTIAIKKDNDLLITLKTPENIDEGKIESQFFNFYESNLKPENYPDRTTKEISSSSLLNFTFNITNRVQASAMNNSKKIENKDGNIIGNILGDENKIDGTVGQNLNPSLAYADYEKAGLKKLLIQLKQAIENEPNLDEKAKKKALKQIEKLQEAAQNPIDENKKELADNAITMLKGIRSDLPAAAALVTICDRIFPLIKQFFGF